MLRELAQQKKVEDGNYLDDEAPDVEPTIQEIADLAGNMIDSPEWYLENWKEYPKELDKWLIFQARKKWRASDIFKKWTPPMDSRDKRMIKEIGWKAYYLEQLDDKYIARNDVGNNVTDEYVLAFTQYANAQHAKETV